jgi:hypothetical protein
MALRIAGGVGAGFFTADFRAGMLSPFSMLILHSSRPFRRRKSANRAHLPQLSLKTKMAAYQHCS